MFGTFRIVALLGRGGMATVYEAYDTRLERAVALKVLPPYFLREKDIARRFEQEAKVIARLEHPAIVPIYANGTDEDIPWMSMRLLVGGNMGTRLKNSPLKPARAIQILGHIAEALDYAHARGVVHRDIKPTNILFDRDERPCVSDFGLAQMLEGSPVVTRVGVVIGTPYYMAPEQALGKSIDHRCDVYSLGIVAYEMLVGKAPFTGDSPLAVLMKHANEPLPIPETSRLPEEMLRAIQRACAKDPSERWPSAGAFAAALKASLDVSTVSSFTPAPGDSADVPPRHPQAGRRRWLTVAAAALPAITVLAWFFFNLGGNQTPPTPSTNLEDVRKVTPPEESSAPKAIPPAVPPPVDRTRVGGQPARPNAGERPTATRPPATHSVPETPLVAPAPDVALPSAPAPTIQESAPPINSPTAQPPSPEAATPPATLSPARTPDVVLPPRRIRAAPAVYPDVARAAQIEGDVVLEATVGTDGTISDVVVVKSVHRLLDGAARDAVPEYDTRPAGETVSRKRFAFVLPSRSGCVDRVRGLRPHAWARAHPVVVGLRVGIAGGYRIVGLVVRARPSIPHEQHDGREDANERDEQRKELEEEHGRSVLLSKHVDPNRQTRRSAIAG